MSDAWHGLAEARRALAAAESDAAGADRLIDDLGDLVRRVDAVAPEPGESERLRPSASACATPTPCCRPPAVRRTCWSPPTATARHQRRRWPSARWPRAEGFDPELGTIGAELRDALVRLEEVARSLHGYAAGVERIPPGSSSSRVGWSCSTTWPAATARGEGALQAADEARDRLDRLGRRDTGLVAPARGRDRRGGPSARSPTTLSTARRKAGVSSRGRSSASWPTWAWPMRASTCASRRASPGVDGADEVRLLVAPNPGGTWGSVAETASGGELSRISLAIRVAAQERSGVPMLVFDEVDAGVGGRTARAVGEKLAALSQTAQVICITHLAAGGRARRPPLPRREGAGRPDGDPRRKASRATPSTATGPHAGR